MNTNNIKIYFHLCLIDDYVNTVHDHIIKNIFDSGLYDATEKINVCLVGDENILVKSTLDKVHYHFLSKNIQTFEFLTIQKLWLESFDSDCNFLYLNGRGVTRKTSEVEAWTDYLLYFNVNKWKERVEDLKEYDCSGTELLQAGAIDNSYSDWSTHYSGNFWWSKSEHIKKLQEPLKLNTSNRFLCERWIGSEKKSKYYNAWFSGVNLYDNIYDESFYVK